MHAICPQILPNMLNIVLTYKRFAVKNLTVLSEYIFSLILKVPVQINMHGECSIRVYIIF